jgi:hypothetical protein
MSQNALVITGYHVLLVEKQGLPRETRTILKNWQSSQDFQLQLQKA